MQDHSHTHLVEDFDFEALYQRNPPMEGASFRLVPWDIGEPQPALVALEQSGQLRGDILDAGCGPGDNALFLAERGYQVTGVDAAPSAIEQARARAQDRGVAPTFVLADATRLEGFEQRFDTVLDSALYHCLGDEQRAAYASALHRVTRPGAQLHLFCFADTDSPGVRLPTRVSQDDLRVHLCRHWTIRSIEPTYYTTAYTREFLQRQDGGTLQAMGIAIDPDSIRTDEHGRVILPVWHLHAVRLPEDEAGRNATADGQRTGSTETGGTT